jgi:hypothetical protein
MDRHGNMHEHGVLLAASVWAEGGDGPRRILELGSAARGRELPICGARRFTFGDLTQDSASALAELSERLPDLDRSYEHAMRWIAQHSADEAAELLGLRGYVRRHPESRHIPWVLAKIDARLRQGLDDDPSGAVADFARKAGVPGEAIKTYRRLTGPYLSIRVKVEDPPGIAGIVLQTPDGAGRIKWGHQGGWSEGGLVFHPAGELPKTNGWREIRVPLVLLRVQDRPITELAMVGKGGKLTWDRLAIVADGEEHVLVEDTWPRKPRHSGNIEFVKSPRHSGEKAFRVVVRRGRRNRPKVVSQDIPLAEPFTGHMIPRPPLQAEGKLVSDLKESVGRLPPEGPAYDFFQNLLGLTSAEGLKRAELIEWFVKTHPGHDRVPELLEEDLNLRREAGQADAEQRVDEFIERAEVPRWKVFAYHRRATHEGKPFLMDWRILGPFPAADRTYPPERDGLDYDAGYQGIDGRIEWKDAQANNRYKHVDMPAVEGRSTVSHAGTWVFVPEDRKAVMNVYFSSGGRVFLNDRIVAVRQGEGWTRRVVDLPAGWNELLVRVRGKGNRSRFRLELADILGRGAPEGLKVSRFRPGDPATRPAEDAGAEEGDGGS